MNTFAVVFIDLQGSSVMQNKRAALQRKLFALRDNLNAQFATALAVPFQIVWGDELKGVYYHPDGLWELFCHTYAFMKDTPFHCAIGLGTIDTPIPQRGPVDINVLDGTAFKAARLAMDELKTFSDITYRLRFGTAGESQYSKSLNAYICIFNDLIKHMTPAQYRHFVAEIPWHQHQKTNNEKLVSRQATWETLQRARINAYRQAHKGLQSLLALGREFPALMLPGSDDN